MLCIHTQFRIQQGSIACLYPTRDATLSRFIPNSGPKVFTPLTNNDVCLCISISIFQQSWNLGLHLLIKTARRLFLPHLCMSYRTVTVILLSWNHCSYLTFRISSFSYQALPPISAHQSTWSVSRKQPSLLTMALIGRFIWVF